MGNRPSNSGNRMSANEPEAEDVSRRDTTDSSDEEEELFSSNLENVSTEDRTFRSILSLLVGRQSVSQTLRWGGKLELQTILCFSQSRRRPLRGPSLS